MKKYIYGTIIYSDDDKYFFLNIYKNIHYFIPFKLFYEYFQNNEVNYRFDILGYSIEPISHGF